VNANREVNAITRSLMPHLVLVNRKTPHTRTRDILGRISQLKREGKAEMSETQKKSPMTTKSR